MVLDTKLGFILHLKNIKNKINKTAGFFRKLQNTLPRASLITIFKSFTKHHLDYGDLIYDWAYNTSFHQNIESIQHNAALAITGAVRGTSREKLCQELGQIFSRNSENIPKLRTKHDLFKFSFFLSTTNKWNNLDPKIRKSNSISIFKSNILKFIRSKPNNVYYCHNPKGIKLLTRLRLGLSHLCEHKFKHNFQDCLNPICLCGNEIENSTHYLLHCPTYTNERLTLLNKIKSINCSILESSDAAVTKILLFGDNTLSNSSNTFILNSTIEYIISTQRFEGSILTPV